MPTEKPSPTGLLGFRFQRSLIDWDDDGVFTDYGWKITGFINGKHRARWNSTRGTTRMWPRLENGADENCNRALTLVVWPLGSLDVWWEPHWRTDNDGMCPECRTLIAESGYSDAIPSTPAS